MVAWDAIQVEENRWREDAVRVQASLHRALDRHGLTAGNAVR